MATNTPVQAACRRVLRSILVGMALLVLTFSFSTHLLAFAHSSVSPGTGKFIEYALPPAANSVAITPGPDGNFWFTQGDGQIGRITPAGKITEYPLRTGAEPLGIIAGPDGNLWFTEQD